MNMQPLKVLIAWVNLTLLFAMNSNGQTYNNSYDMAWKKVDELINQKGLTESALAEVKKIYNKAKKEKQDAQLIKALIYQVSLQQQKEEDAEIKGIAELEKEISAAAEPAKSILYSILAGQYWQYLQQNRWKFYNRTATVQFKKDDIATWGIDDFHRVISSAYQNSVKQSAILKRTRLERFEPLIIKGNVRYLRPTLYDLLCHKALDYFENDERDIAKPAYAFEIKDIKAFAAAPEFARHRFTTQDSTSLYYLALNIYKDLTGFHLADAKPGALIDVDLKRLQFVRRQAVLLNKDELYRNALEKIYNDFETDSASAQAGYLLAQYHSEKGRGYEPGRSATADRNAYKTAKATCEEVIARFPKSEGGINCRNLLNEILKKELHLQTEKVNLPGQPFRTLVNFRNFSQLHYRIIAVEDGFPANEKDRWSDNYWKKLTGLNPVRSITQTLPAADDYMNHAAEIKIDGLPAGRYAMLASVSPDFGLDKNPMAVQYFYVSNISYINNANNYFTLHRETGKPLGNATVQVWQNEYDYNTSKQKTIAREKLTADANGYFRLAVDKTNNRNIRLEINWEKDRLFLDDADYTYYRSETEEAKDKEDYEEDNRKAFLFTDRSLYRPGQTVYFKGIVITKDFESRQYKVIPGFKTTIELHDANSEKIDSIEVASNEFGSYSGKFKLPENLLNGEFRIEDYETDASADFNVEEYKRPKFYVEYEPVKGSFRLNDTVRITGVAKAYAGNAIDGAMVKYRVTRNARFPYPWLFRKWGYPRSSSMEITNGEIKTGADGKFSIAFEAIPDLSIDKNFAPVFEYEINADVTDLNGETRSGETTVSVGYKALDMQITSPKGNMLPVDSIQQLFISTKNLAGAFEPAEIKVSIFPLQSQGRLIRQRYWSEPDTFVMSKEEYLKNFPYDEYKDESKKENWPKANRVYLRIDSTQPNKKIELRTPNWAPGWYVIEAVTKDKYGEEVKAIHYIQLFDSKNKLSGLQAYTWSMGNMQTASPGENANIEIGSSADELWVIQEVERKNDARSMKYDVRSKMYEADDNRKNAKNKTTLHAPPTPESPLPQYNFITLNNETKVFSFPVTENDRGGFGVLHAFVKHNRFFSLNNTVTVPWDNKELNISYTTYRDKTLPGSKEQWKIKISGNKGEKMAAEILAGMYDASLDQFKPHGWNTPDIYEFYYRGNNWAGNNNFSVEQSQQKIEYRGYMAIKEKIYDDFIWGDFNPAFVRREMMQMRMTAPSMAADSFKLSEEVTVKKNLAGSVSAVTIRGMATIKSANKVLIIIDGVPFEGSRDDINPDNIINLEVLKAENAIAIYGTAGANGAILITTKSGATKKKEEQVTVRKNFHETAFFFPDLKTDADGNVEFSFTIPEALTQWKWQTLAHTKDLAFGFGTKTIITQKELMVQPNAPRFMREGDAVEFSAKISNLTAKEVTGQAQLQLIDATTQQPVDGWFKNIFPVQYFTAPASQSTVVKFNIEIPYNFNQPLLYRVIAKAPLSAAGRGDGGEVSDGEENVIPVLTNRILVTESLPIQVRGGGTKNFKFEKLLNNKSESLSHQSLTVEFSSNPAWYAVQSLPYLMEYPYECAEQVFNRYYANALASMVANSSPKIKAVFEKWKTDSLPAGEGRGGALISNLQKNEELKSVLLQETPWVLQAKTENQQKKNIALLFDMVRMSKELGSSLEKLKQMQSPNGGFVWFKGGPDDRFITQYIITGLARLQHLGALSKEQKEEWNEIVKPAISYLDKKLAADYDNLIRYKADLKKNNLSYIQIQYLYMRSFFKERPIPKASQTAHNYFFKQSQLYWLQQNKYMQGMIALALYRYNDAVTAKAILASLKENAIKDEEKGMYWKDNTAGYYWHQAPVETQSLLIETFAEAGKDKEAVELMKLWLLRQKQTQNWKTTKATADACYALLLQDANLLTHESTVEIKLGSLSFTSPSGGGWEGVGYFKKTIDGKNVSSDMGKIDISLSSPTGGGQVGAWGAIYWQYFENLDQITPASTPLQLKKKLFIEKNTERGPVLQPVNEGDEIKVGDKLKVRIELRSDRDMEYVHMKDMRAAGTEPVSVLSSYKWLGGLGYYESTKDASTNFFFNWLPKGTYVFEYPLFVTHAGKFSAGIANIQCMYAPEFTSHSEGINIKVR